MDRPGVLRAPVAALPRKPTEQLAALPRLSVVVVNYHHWEDTFQLIRQLRSSAPLQHGSAEIVVVDNHSPSHPGIRTLRRQPGVSLRRWRHNRGFAQAVNEGCRLSRGDWLLLLNPDVTVDADFLEAALHVASQMESARPDVGIVGFRLRNPDGSLQRSTGTLPTLNSTFAGLLRPRAERKYQQAPLTHATRVEWATGCCLLIRRRCWEAVRGLDTNFFLYYEDVDLCARAAAQGWQTWYEPAIALTHHQPLHGRAVSPLLRLITRHALLTYAQKHWPTLQQTFLARVITCESWWRQLQARRHGDGHAAKLFGQLRQLTADFLRGDPQHAGRRLRGVLRREEERHAAAVHRDPKPQSPRSSRSVSCVGDPAHAASYGNPRY